MDTDTDTEPNRIYDVPVFRYGGAIPKLVKKRDRYRYYTDTEIPGIYTGIRYFGILSSLCPNAPPTRHETTPTA